MVVAVTMVETRMTIVARGEEKTSEQELLSRRLYLRCEERSVSASQRLSRQERELHASWEGVSQTIKRTSRKKHSQDKQKEDNDIHCAPRYWRRVQESKPRK